MLIPYFKSFKKWDIIFRAKRLVSIIACVYKEKIACINRLNNNESRLKVLFNDKKIIVRMLIVILIKTLFVPDEFSWNILIVNNNGNILRLHHFLFFFFFVFSFWEDFSQISTTMPSIKHFMNRINNNYEFSD